jgi:hypothetical protein
MTETLTGILTEIRQVDNHYDLGIRTGEGERYIRVQERDVPAPLAAGDKLEVELKGGSVTKLKKRE